MEVRLVGGRGMGVYCSKIRVGLTSRTLKVKLITLISSDMVKHWAN
jgi:hypothetical protein